MANNGVASQGTELAFSAAAPATVDQAGYEALTWTPWDEATNIGDVGPSVDIQEYTPVKSGFKVKIPTVVDQGMIEGEAPFDSTDPAFQIVRTAIRARPIARLFFRITYSNGAVEFGEARPSQFRKKVGGAAAILMLAFSLPISGQTVEVDAA